MAVDRDDVRRVAALARLAFGDDELDAFATEMSGILALFDRLSEVDTDGVEPAFRVLRRASVFREDEPGDMLRREDALANAPDPLVGSFRVPAVISDE